MGGVLRAAERKRLGAAHLRLLRPVLRVRARDRTKGEGEITERNR